MLICAPEPIRNCCRVFAADGSILGQMYQTHARDWHNENLSLRKFPSAISVRNLSNDVPDEAVDALLNTARKNSKIFQRYFKLKARHLGLEKLRRYDIYAPIANSEKNFAYETAVNMVFEFIRNFRAADRLAGAARLRPGTCR